MGQQGLAQAMMALHQAVASSARHPAQLNDLAVQTAACLAAGEGVDSLDVVALSQASANRIEPADPAQTYRLGYASGACEAAAMILQASRQLRLEAMLDRAPARRVSQALAGKPMKLTELAAAVSRDPGNVSRLVDDLRRAGLLETERDVEDARAVVVFLSADGRTALERWSAAHVRDGAW